MKILNSIRKKYAIIKGGETYLNYLRSCGITIGKGCSIRQPSTIQIDCTRPYLVEIGDYVRLNQGLTILTHDFATVVFDNLFNEFLASSGKVKIGNNVYFGQKCTVLKGVTIGDNCIIGYGSTVIKDIPANSVAVGSPARVICSLEEYYEKRIEKSLEEALELARIIKEKKKRMPKPEDFFEEFVYFVSGNEVDKYPEIPIEKQIKSTKKEENFDSWKKNHQAIYKSFQEFLVAAGVMEVS